MASPRAAGRSRRNLLSSAAGLAAMLAGCASSADPDAARPDLVQASGASSSSFGSLSPTLWLENGRQNVDVAMRDLRQRADGVWQATVTATGGAARSISGVPVATTQACPIIDDVPDCASGARMACAREGYRDGAPIASVRYESCRGLAALSQGAAAVCRTKQRLQSAFCW